MPTTLDRDAVEEHYAREKQRARRRNWLEGVILLIIAAAALVICNLWLVQP